MSKLRTFKHPTNESGIGFIVREPERNEFGYPQDDFSNGCTCNKRDSGSLGLSADALRIVEQIKKEKEVGDDRNTSF